jgi:hypothetical protein
MYIRWGSITSCILKVATAPFLIYLVPSLSEYGRWNGNRMREVEVREINADDAVASVA